MPFRGTAYRVELRECGLGPEPAGVVAGGGEELSGAVRTDTRQPDERRAVCEDEIGDALLEACQVGIEDSDPTGELAQREPGLLFDEVRVVVSEAASPCELVASRQPVAEPVPESRRGRHDDRAMTWLIARVRSSLAAWPTISRWRMLRRCRRETWVRRSLDRTARPLLGGPSHDGCHTLRSSS